MAYLPSRTVISQFPEKCGLGSNPCFEGPVINYVEGEQAKKRGKRQVKLYSYEKNKGGGVSHAERGGGTTDFGVVSTWEHEVLAILKGSVQQVSAL